MGAVSYTHLDVYKRQDKERAMEKGLTVAQIFGEVSRQVDEGKRATTINMDNKDYPVIVLNTLSLIHI